MAETTPVTHDLKQKVMSLIERDRPGIHAGTTQFWWGLPGVACGPGGATGSFTPLETVEIADSMVAAKTYALAAIGAGSRSCPRRGSAVGG